MIINPCQSCQIVTILVSFWFIITSLAFFFNISKLYYSKNPSIRRITLIIKMKMHRDLANTLREVSFLTHLLVVVIKRRIKEIQSLYEIIFRRVYIDNRIYSILRNKSRITYCNTAVR